MQELIKSLTSKVDITEAQAAKVIDVVKEFVSDKLPKAIATPVMGALEGKDDLASQIAEGADGVMGKLGGMLGGK